jgi:hypothetical protein
VTAVSEKTLEYDESTSQGRYFRVQFGPDMLGLDLAYSKDNDAVGGLAGGRVRMRMGQ